MSFHDDGDGESTMKIDNEEEGITHERAKGDYHQLRCDERNPLSWKGRRSVVWVWAKVVAGVIVLITLACVFVKWVFPFLMKKGLRPFIEWEASTFSNPVLAAILFGSLALFPSFLLPSIPSMWVAGMAFGYVNAFLIIAPAVAVGVSLPYFIGSIFADHLQSWLYSYPQHAALLRAAGEGGWFHQFKTVALIRVSPFPYIVYNYFAIATKVKYAPYLVGSLVGMLPDIFLSIYTGNTMKTLANASSHHTSQMILNGVGFSATLAATVFITVYARKKLQQPESLLLH